MKWKPSFYDLVEPIRLREPLAEFLGAVDEGEDLVFAYTDAVKCAGHSCPAVSGAYMATRKALKALYGEETPVRGAVQVNVLGRPEHGANGPISQVITLITGAAPETGFAGLGQRFARRNKLAFDEERAEPNTFIFTREDTGKSVSVSYHPERLPQDPEMPLLMTKCLVGTATDAQKERFQQIWQERVRAVLLEEVEGLFHVEEVSP